MMHLPSGSIFILSIFLLSSDASFGTSVCEQNSAHNIFAADALLNSTVRLYSQHYHYDLVLFKKTISNKLPVFLETSNGTQIFGFLKGATQNAFNHSLIDTTEMSRTSVTFSDYANNELTTLFSSGNFNGSGHYWTMKTHENVLQSDGSISDILYPVNGSLPVITAAFRLFTRGSQLIFFILQGKEVVYLNVDINDFNSTETHRAIHFLVRDEKHHKGKVPPGITAAVVIHFAENENALVFFRCNQYCFVLFHNSKWNFDKCNKSTSWRNLSQFQIGEEPNGERILPLFYRSQVPSTRADRMFAALSNSLDKVSNFCDSAKNRVKALFRKFPILAWCLPLAIFVQLFYCCWVFSVARNKRGAYLIRDPESDTLVH